MIIETKSLKDIELKKMCLGPTEVVYYPKVIGLCRKPYANHPKGCPNFGKRPYCPPKVPQFLNVYQKDAFVVAVGLNFRDYLEMMKKKHPLWTDRALRNPLYWQGYLRKKLKEYARDTLDKMGNNGEVVIDPEGMGVNITQTCLNIGLRLEWPPENWVYKIVLIAKKKKE